MKNKLFILAALLSVALFSCKKESIIQERPKTFEDFEKIMAADLDFNKFISASLELEKNYSDTYSPSIIITEAPKKKIFTEEEITELKEIKNFETLSEFLKIHKVENYEEKINNLKTQSKSFYNFIIKYPEFSKLNNEEKIKLIHQSMIAKNDFNKFLRIQNINSQGKIMAADPMQLYGLAIQACQDSYRSNFDIIWVSADSGMAINAWNGLGTAGIFITACILTVIADNARGNCMDNAAAVLYLSIE